MSATTSAAEPRPPILIELDGEFWEGQLDRAAAWLGNVVLVQASFRTLADDAAAAVEQPQFRHFS